MSERRASQEQARLLREDGCPLASRNGAEDCTGVEVFPSSWYKKKLWEAAGRPRLLSFLLKIIRSCWLICFGPQLSDPSFLSPLPAQEEGMP